jgi:hypothetical protein
MSRTGRYVIWCPGAAFAVFAFVFVAAPSLMAPLFDNAVSIAGVPAGLVVTAAFWFALSLVGLSVAERTRRADARLGVILGIVILTTIFMMLEPAVIQVIENMRI